MLNDKKQFQFRTREEYKKVKAYSRAQLEEYIDKEVQRAKQGGALWISERLKQTYNDGWADCVKTSEKVLGNYVANKLASEDAAIYYAIERTSGIGKQRGKALLNKVYEFRDLAMKEEKDAMDKTIEQLINGGREDV